MQRNPQKRWSRSDKITNEPPWSQKKKIMCWSYETWWWWHMLINYNEHTKGLVFSKYQLFAYSIWYDSKKFQLTAWFLFFLIYPIITLFPLIWNDLLASTKQKNVKTFRDIKWHKLFQCIFDAGKAFQKCVSYGDINNNFNQTILHEQ